MTVTACGVIWTGATGTPRPAGGAAIKSAYAAGARAFRIAAEYPAEQGGLDCWLNCTQAEAESACRAVGEFVGKPAQSAVIYGHGTIQPLTLASYTAEWQAAHPSCLPSPLPADALGVLRVRLEFAVDEDQETGAEDQSAAQVWHAPALAGPWTATEWICEGAADGLGSYLGEFQAHVDGEAPDTALLGKWVRLTDWEATPTVYMHGVILGANIASRDNDGAPLPARVVYRCAGLGEALRTLYLPVWYHSKLAGTPMQAQSDLAGFHDAGGPLDFNSGGRADMGPTVAIADGVSCRIHALDGSEEQWTAADALATIAAHVRAQWGFDLTVEAGGADLTYTGSFTAAGASVLDMLTSILRPEFDRTFRLAEDGGGGIKVHVVDLAAAGGPVDLGDAAVGSWSVDVDAMGQADTQYYAGGASVYLRTLRYDGTTERALGKGWTAAQEAEWSALIEPDDPAKTAELREQGEVSQVYRRFIINPSWDSGPFAGLVPRLPFMREETGAGEETGRLLGSESYPQGRVGWPIERDLPLTTNRDWTLYDQVTDPLDDAEGPLVYLWKAGGDPEIIPVHFTFQVQVGDAGGSLLVGRTGADAMTIESRLSDGYDIIATVGLRHMFEIRTSALGAVDGFDAPRTDLPRIGWYALPTAEFSQTWVAPRTVWKINEAGDDWVLAGEDPQPANPWRVDVGQDQQGPRDKMRRFHLTPDTSATWRRGGLDVVEPLPGAVLGQASIVIAPGEDAVTVELRDIPVTRRSWTFRRGAEGMQWTADRIWPALGQPNVVVDGLSKALRRPAYDAEVARRDAR